MAWGFGGARGELGRRLGMGRRGAAMARLCSLTLELEEEERKCERELRQVASSGRRCGGLDYVAGQHSTAE